MRNPIPSLFTFSYERSSSTNVHSECLLLSVQRLEAVSLTFSSNKCSLTQTLLFYLENAVYFYYSIVDGRHVALRD